jgi:arylsulfatase A-like enzyme
MTGLYQTTIGAHQHRSHRDDGYRLPEGVRVLTDLLRDAGYFTVNVRQFPRGLDLRGTAKTDWNFTYVGQPFDSDRWEDLKGRQPFYAQVNFTETHRPFKAPKRADPKAVPIPPYYPDDPITRADMAAYLDSASELDRKVGRVLDQLQADGLADDTIVLFFGDNGEAHHRGKCFCYEEGLHVPLILRWPKNFPAPRHGAPGTADDRLLMAIDLAPTMLAAAGAAVPPVMQGRAFLGEIARGDPPRRAAGAPREYAFGARDRCDEVSMRLRTVRDRRFRYIRNFTPEVPFTTPQKYRQDQYPVWNLLLAMKAEGRVEPPISAFCADRMPEEELYDLLADPHQVRNLAADPAHRGTLERLRGVLEKWIEETADQGRTPEPPEVAARKGLTKPGGNPGASAIRPR